MPLPEDQLDVVVPVAQQLHHLAEGLARHHKAVLRAAPDGLLPDGEAVAVHRNQADFPLLDLEQRAGVHGLRVRLRDREQRLADHALQHGGGQREARVAADARQLGVLLGRDAGHGELRLAAPDIGELLVVGLEPDRLAGQPADDVPEQARAHHDAPLFGDLRLDFRGHADLKVVAAQADPAVLRREEDALQRRDGRLRGDRALDIQYRFVQFLPVALEFHHNVASFLIIKYVSV